MRSAAREEAVQLTAHLPSSSAEEPPDQEAGGGAAAAPAPHAGSSQRPRGTAQQRALCACIAVCAGALALATLVMVAVKCAGASGCWGAPPPPRVAAEAAFIALDTPDTVTRIAFGSCTSYDVRPQEIWEQGVIPSKPDAWLWLGDVSGRLCRAARQPRTTSRRAAALATAPSPSLTHQTHTDVLC